VADPEAHSSYTPPSVTYHGRVGELTLSHGLLVGAQAVRFAASFASSLNSMHTTGRGGSTVLGAHPAAGGAHGGVPDPGFGGGGSPSGSAEGTQLLNGDPAAAGTSGAGTGGGSAPGAGGSGSGGGGGGAKLPFTGLAVLAVSGVGAALASAGVAIRRFTGRGDRTAP
jgi:hypothetical protein